MPTSKLSTALNPFSHLVDTKNYKASRVRNSTLLRRFEDTFEAFYGKLDVYESKVKLSLADITVIPLLTRLLTNYNGRIDSANPIAKFFYGLASFAKLIVSAVLTLASSIIVLLVHLPFKLAKHLAMKTLAKAKGRKIIEREIDSACFYDKEEAKSSTHSQQTVKIESLSQEQPTLEKIIEDCERQLKPKEKLVITPFYQTDANSSFLAYKAPSLSQEKRIISLALRKDISIDDFGGTQKYVEAIIDVTPENKYGIQTLLKFNLFGTTTNLEYRDLVETVEKQCGLKN